MSRLWTIKKQEVLDAQSWNPIESPDLSSLERCCFIINIMLFDNQALFLPLPVVIGMALHNSWTIRQFSLAYDRFPFIYILAKIYGEELWCTLPDPVPLQIDALSFDSVRTGGRDFFVYMPLYRRSLFRQFFVPFKARNCLDAACNIYQRFSLSRTQPSLSSFLDSEHYLSCISPPRTILSI